MKYLLSLLIMVITTFIVNVPSAHAEEQVKQEMSVEDIKDLKSKIVALEKTLQDKEEPAGSKSAADVADKALDLFGGMIGTVSEAIKKIAPEVWRIMIKQQYANAALYSLTPLLLLIASLVTRKYVKSALVISKDDSSNLSGLKYFLSFLSQIAPVGFGIWLAISASFSVAMIINPEYYAIKDILELALGKK